MVSFPKNGRKIRMPERHPSTKKVAFIKSSSRWPMGLAYVNQSRRNWHWTKKLITEIVHPGPLGPRAPSALSGMSRHPRPSGYLPFPPFFRLVPLPIARVFPRTRSAPGPRYYSSGTDIRLPASRLCSLLLGCAGSRPKSGERDIFRPVLPLLFLSLFLPFSLSPPPPISSPFFLEISNE